MVNTGASVLMQWYPNLKCPDDLMFCGSSVIFALNAGEDNTLKSFLLTQKHFMNKRKATVNQSFSNSCLLRRITGGLRC